MNQALVRWNTLTCLISYHCSVWFRIRIVLAALINGDIEDARAFLESCSVFALAEGLGGVESLVDYPSILAHASVPRSALHLG